MIASGNINSRNAIVTKTPVCCVPIFESFPQCGHFSVNAVNCCPHPRQIFFAIGLDGSDMIVNDMRGVASGQWLVVSSELIFLTTGH